MSLLENNYCLYGTQDYSTHKNEDNFDKHPGSSQGVDKVDTVKSALKVLNNYCKEQGPTNVDVTYWEGELRVMMETVKRIRESVSLRTKVDSVFNFPVDEVTAVAKTNVTEEELKASMAEIERMESVLKDKQAEEKKAKQSTIQSEEESRDLLTRMTCFEGCSGIRSNVAEFLKLLSDLDTVESDYPILPPMDGVEQKEQAAEQKDKDNEKKENPVPLKQKASNFKFIQRNIKLAKCGRGTLSITEEEKSRLDDILEELENPSESAEETKEAPPKGEGEALDSTPEEGVYGIDSEMKSILSQIDQQLEVFRNQRCCPSETTISYLEKDKSEEKISAEDEKQNANRKAKREKTPDRLEKINKQLSQMNSVSKEEVKPLTEREMASLVQQSKWSLEEWKKTGAEEIRELEEAGWPDLKPPEEVIAELVSNAKTMMPRFKYRFGKT